MKAVLIDDEKNALEMLEWQLQNYCPQVQIMALCNSADKGIAAIQEYQPQLVFLDIEMPVKNGFEVLQQFPDPTFETIFTTAYNQFALKAFRFAAFDYLLKPIDAEDLTKTIQRYQRQRLNSNFKQQLEILMQQYVSPNSLPEKVSFSTQQAIHFVKPETIVYCESDSNYTTLFFVDKTKLVVSKTLKDVEELLVGYQFMRIHHSYLINLKEVSRYIKTEGGAIEMNDGAQLPISRQRKDELMRILSL
ncbi:DNA-binding response regulator [Solitalea longa]|uniref:DNA-binding response regulator n=1 Tax=Solitalea longa TaxID=2079460 RepID=A0A2S5A7I2_9SPHI|nr:LytTR family DNA-binding domain-containing protein [Solitalea longa]POY38474.1 DNA-binding response regulator [Solitalea longa]